MQFSRLTNFEKVLDFNEKFGIKVFKEPQLDIFDKEPKLVELRMNLIREEIKELEEAVKNKDLVETIDALSDIIYVILGMGCSLGINLNGVSNSEDFNGKFSINSPTYPKLDIFEKEQNKIESIMNSIRAKMIHLEQVVKNKNLIEIINCLPNLLYLIQNLGYYLDINLNLAFNIVHDSNMSKLCRTEEKAKETVYWYEKNKEKLGYDSPSYRLSEDGEYYVVYNKSTGKILKSIDYTPANFDALFGKNMTNKS